MGICESKVEPKQSADIINPHLRIDPPFNSPKYKSDQREPEKEKNNENDINNLNYDNKIDDTNISSEKIKQEFENLTKNPLFGMGITVGMPDENNIFRWLITYLGPRDTSYGGRGGRVFYVEIIFPKLYPEQAPELIFITPIYHPNVNMRKSYNNIPLGQVAFKDIKNWKPTYTIKEVLTKLYSFFYYPNLDLAYSLEIAKEYKENRNLFENKVKFFTKKYATPDLGIKKYEYWDFSFNYNDFNSLGIKQIENTLNNKVKKVNKNYDDNQSVTLFFDLNGIIETRINCKFNELIKDIIKKVFDQYGITDKNNILAIHFGRKIELDVPLGEYHFKNNYRITIIYDI